MVRKYVLFTFCWLLFCSGLLCANISLDSAILLAKKQNKSFNTQKNTLQAAEWQKKNALAQFLPKVSFRETALRLDSNPILLPAMDFGTFTIPEIKGAKQNYTSEININQVLFTGGKLNLNYKISDLSLAQNKIQNRIEEQKLELVTAQLYFQILKLQDIKRLIQESIKTYQNHYDKALVKQQNGSALLSEILQWKVKLEEAQGNLKNLDNALQLTCDTWNQHLGIKDNAEQVLPETIDLNSATNQALNYSLYDENQKQSYLAAQLDSFTLKNNSLKILSLNKKLLDNSLKMTKSEFLPTLALNFNYQFENDDKLNFKDSESWNFIALLEVPLFNGGTNYTAFKAKQFEVNKQQDELDNSSELMRIQTKKIILDMFDLSIKISTDKTNIQLAEENRRQVNQLVSQGMATFNDQMDAEILYLSIQNNYISDIYDYLINDYEIKRDCEE